MKKIFITGATTGIGYELAILYSNSNYLVGICGRDLSKLPKDFKSLYPEIKAYQVDVTDGDKLLQVVKEFSDGELDIMIANAGVAVGQKTRIPDFNRSRSMININVIGVLNSFDAALSIMGPKKNGHLVAISSVAGMIGVPKAAAYSASKAAVTKICESFSIDLISDGIHVTNIAPGFVDTPLTKQNNHKMPFLLNAKQASLKIKNAIDKKKILFIFPWQMKFIIYLLDRMPRWIYRLLMKNINWGE